MAHLDVSQWLVTPLNPPTSTSNGLDYTRCAELHNYIAQVGWGGSGRSLDDFPQATWFEKYGEAAENVRDRLDPSLAKFLELSYHGDHTQTAFYYWVTGFDQPEGLWFADDDFDSRYLTLYAQNAGIGTKADGLNYDQESHLAIFQMDVTDASVTRDEDDTPPPWQPLETVLSAWIEMIEIGKILPAEEVVNLENEKMDPWLWYSYSEKQVQATVTAFNKLVTAIESRMPLQNTPGSQSILARSEDSLISTSVLDSASVPESCFVRSFLTSARKPDFKYIAPGLLLPSDSSFEQPLTTVLNEDEDSLPIPPVLLFRADTPKTYSLEPNDSEANPFCEPYNRPDDDDSTKELPAGLYTESIDRKLYDNTEDGFRLLLPYVLGSNGYVRKSDSARFEDGAGLYQHGYQPFGGDPWRAQRLVKLFENWRGMVARGDWGVDENGVMGGIDTFKEADTETGWRKYWIESSW